MQANFELSPGGQIVIRINPENTLEEVVMAIFKNEAGAKSDIVTEPGSSDALFYPKPDPP